jgi:hypothetical protein
MYVCVPRWFYTLGRMQKKIEDSNECVFNIGIRAKTCLFVHRVFQAENS